MRKTAVVAGMGLILISAAFSGGAAQAQGVPAVYAIVGAKIEIGDGRVIEKGTVVLRDGMIEAVGVDVKAPPDAEIFKGDGLVVYPGFVDAHATSGLKLPDAAPTQDTPPDTETEASPAMREANRRGVRPEIRAADYLNFSDSALVTSRQNGFTTEFVTPNSGIINGTGTLVNLSGKPRRDCVIKSGIAAYFTFNTGGRGGGGGGGYPGSLLGVFAHIRQTLLDAQRFDLQTAAFAQNGGPRPPADETLAALQPVLKGTLLTLFDADSEREIVRSVKLAEEFHLKPVISGGLYAYKQANMLASKHIPVLVSLNFGREPGTALAPPRPPAGFKPPVGAPPSGTIPPSGVPPLSGASLPAGTPPKPGLAPDKPDDQTKKEDPDADIPDTEMTERKRLYAEKVANIAALDKAGVIFAFTLREIRNTPDFWTALRRALKAGLPREAALKALTVNAAKIYGVEKQLGTVEAGKIAVITVMTGDFASEKSKVKYTFIDRTKFDEETDKSASPRQGAFPLPTRHLEEEDPFFKE